MRLVRLCDLGLPLLAFHDAELGIDHEPYRFPDGVGPVHEDAFLNELVDLGHEVVRELHARRHRICHTLVYPCIP